MRPVWFAPWHQGLTPGCCVLAISELPWGRVGFPDPALVPQPSGDLWHPCIPRGTGPVERSLPQTGLFPSQVRTNPTTSITTSQSRRNRALSIGRTSHQGRGNLSFPGYLFCQCFLFGGGCCFPASQVVFTCSFCSLCTGAHSWLLTLLLPHLHAPLTASFPIQTT